MYKQAMQMPQLELELFIYILVFVFILVYVLLEYSSYTISIIGYILKMLATYIYTLFNKTSKTTNTFVDLIYLVTQAILVTTDNVLIIKILKFVLIGFIFFSAIQMGLFYDFQFLYYVF